MRAALIYTLHSNVTLARWNAARACATYLDEHRELYQGKRVLELGAGAGLPGIVTILNGSTHVRMQWLTPETLF